MNEAIHQTLAQLKERLGESMYTDQRRVQSILGNAALLDLPKTAFLSSLRIAPAASRVCGVTARIRNRFILTHCDDAVIGSLNPESGLAALLREFPVLKHDQGARQAPPFRQCH